MHKNLTRYFLLLRPHQWLKNLLLLFPPFFGGNIMEPAVFTSIVPSLLSFSLAASCGYIVNDIGDREFDRCHATKKQRPIACGDISIPLASIIAASLYVAAVLLSVSVSRRFEGYLIIYLFTSFLYTLYFKKIIILDICFISFGFVIRVLAGGEAFHVPVTKWLLLAVSLVSLFLAAGKRLGELNALGIDASIHRKSLLYYSRSFLDAILWFAGFAAIVTYALYTIENKRVMFYTVPLAAYGILRYIFIAKKGKGDPTEALLFDWQIMTVGIIWAGMIGLILYR